MFKQIQRSFSARISFYVTSFILILSVTAFIIFFHFASQSIESSTHEKIELIADNADLEVAALLNAVQKIPDNMRWVIPNYLNNPDSLFNITRKIVQNNTEIFSCAIAFEPFYFKSKGRFFAPYSYMRGNSVITTQIGNEEYNYFEKNWYRIAKEKGLSRWSRPMPNAGEGHIITSTYSIPIRDDANRIIGIFSVDLSTKWITDLVNAATPYQNSYTIVVDKAGNYIVGRKDGPHTDSTIFSAAARMEDTTANFVARQLTEGEDGRTLFYDNGVKSYAYYSPITSTDWYMAIICPYDEMFRPLYHFNAVILIAFIVVMGLIYLVCSLTVKQLTHPLKSLANYTRTIGNGHFDTPLPEIKSQDEMKELYDSFRDMQQKLSDYIEDLKVTTAAKEKMESELEIAHKIQMGMLPKIFPAFPDRKEVDLFAVLNPAKQVGGDLYDFFIVGDDLYFAIGDVSGKGVPASLMMAGTTSLLRSLSPHHLAPAKLLYALNNNIIGTNNSDMFITFFIGMLSLRTGLMRYSSAGHTPPILTTPSRQVTLLDINPHLPLGLIKDYEYTEQTYTFTLGSGILLYTDGVTDAENSGQQFYTRTRLLDAVRRNNRLNPKEFIEGIMADIEAHVEDAEQSDDLTMLSVVYGTIWQGNGNETKT